MHTYQLSQHTGLFCLELVSIMNTDTTCMSPILPILDGNSITTTAKELIPMTTMKHHSHCPGLLQWFLWKSFQRNASPNVIHPQLSVHCSWLWQGHCHRPNTTQPISPQNRTPCLPGPHLIPMGTQQIQQHPATSQIHWHAWAPNTTKWPYYKHHPQQHKHTCTHTNATKPNSSCSQNMHGPANVNLQDITQTPYTNTTPNKVTTDNNNAFTYPDTPRQNHFIGMLPPDSTVSLPTQFPQGKPATWPIPLPLDWTTKPTTV